MNKKWVLGIILVLTFLMVVLIFIFKDASRYHKLILSEDKWVSILQKREESTSIQIEAIAFNDFSLLIDEDHSKIYYSIPDQVNQFNPNVSYISSKKKDRVVFLEKMSDEKIKENSSVSVMVYDDENYHIYDLIVTSLPILNIDYSEESKSRNIPMTLSVYDNRSDAFSRNMESKGTIDVSTSIDQKNDYRFSLSLESLGGNKRENMISLLGMEKHSEYLLNSMVEDDLDVRDIFSSNLWNDLDKNSRDNYQYVELFVNHEYVGLYTLGYRIERETVRLGRDDFLFYKKSLSHSEDLFLEDEKLEGYVLYDRFMDKIGGRERVNSTLKENVDAWHELNSYYQVLASGDSREIRNRVNLSNSIDLYLFYLFVQPEEHLNEETFSSTYLFFRKKGGTYQVEYMPSMLSDTFSVSYSDNRFVMPYNPVSVLIDLKDEKIVKEVQEEYQSLREDKWSLKNLTNRLEELESSLTQSGAVIRDREKWNLVEGDDMSSFSDYVMKRLEAMDQFIENL